jgi:iron-sulfur cluster repair protein YtfE (RIC family)
MGYNDGMGVERPTLLACDVHLEGDVALLLEQYRQVLNRDLRRRGWRLLSQADLVRAVVERFLRDHREDIELARV